MTVVVLLLSACRQEPPGTPNLPPARRGRMVSAIVVTIQTTVQPANRTTTHTLLIAGNKARSTDEAERWRLYDLANHNVTLVNDLNGTYRTEPLDSVLARRRTALRRPVDRELPVAQFQATGAQREILSLPATQALIRLGGYQRELWFGSHPRIPGHLFAMIHGTTDPSTRLGGISAEADEELLGMRGFPLIDRAELPFGNAVMVVDRRVTAIQERDVQASLLEIPREYREVTEPDGSRKQTYPEPKARDLRKSPP